MSLIAKQVLVTVIFAAELFAVWALNRDTKVMDPVLQEEALKRYGFYLTESAKQCGIDFIRMGRKDTEPGWEVGEFLSVNGADVVNPPSPGVALKR